MKRSVRSIFGGTTGKTLAEGILLVLLLAMISDPRVSGQKVVTDTLAGIEFISPENITVGGFLGEELHQSETGRLMQLPNWNDGELISMFSKEARLNHNKTDWYGEHAGKWMYATALAVARTNDPGLKSLLLKTAGYLVDNQEPDGYLGTYSPGVRFTNSKVSHKHSWDVWDQSYMVLGLLEVNHFYPDPVYSDAAKKIGELFLKTFGDGRQNITDYGTREGISSTIILDPVVELYKLTRDERYLSFAKLILKEMNEKEGLMLIPAALHNRDMSTVGEGKAYQVIWNLKAIADLVAVTGDLTYLKAVENAWKEILNDHLTICGGPWGGIGNFYECFDKAGFWSPYGFTETCSSMAWIQLNRELLSLTGSACYAQEIEKTAFNALSGAAYPDGVNWCYHSFVNGRRHAANFNDCCPSSGAMALEDVAGSIYGLRENGISCNLYTESSADIMLENTRVSISQQTMYPFDGNIRITVSPEKSSSFPLFLRIPDWADTVSVRINGKIPDTAIAGSGEYFKISRVWKKNDQIELSFPFRLKVHHRSEFALIPQSRKDIYRVDWFSLSRGPLVYATNGLIDGENREKVIPLSGSGPEALFIPVKTEGKFQGTRYILKTGNNGEIEFLPYFEAGGRTPGTWRLTWVQDAISQ